jgi:hypothetical protein
VQTPGRDGSLSEPSSHRSGRAGGHLAAREWAVLCRIPTNQLESSWLVESSPPESPFNLQELEKEGKKGGETGFRTRCQAILSLAHLGGSLGTRAGTATLAWQGVKETRSPLRYGKGQIQLVEEATQGASKVHRAMVTIRQALESVPCITSAVVELLLGHIRV